MKDRTPIWHSAFGIPHSAFAGFVRERLVFAKLAALVLWVCYAGSILLGDGWGTYNLIGEVSCADHLAWYTAARLIREGKPEKVYDNDFVAEYQQAMLAGRWKSVMAYRNPPFYALLYYPTAGWPYAASAWFWAAVSLAAFAVGVWWLVTAPSVSPPPEGEGPGEGLSTSPAHPQVPGGADRPRADARGSPGAGAGPGYWTVLFWVLSFYPVFCALSYGQNTPLSFLVFAGTYRLLAAGRPFAAGLAAGLLWFKPTLLVGLVVWGLLDIRRKWPCALGAVVTGAALTAGSYPLVPEVWAGFVRTLTDNAGYANFEQWKMHNPLSFWRLLFPDLEDRWRWRLAALCSAAAVGLFVRLWQRRRDDLPVMFGAVVFLTLLAAPHALIYEWALLAVTGVLWWPQTRRDPDRWLLVYGAVWLVTFVSTHFTELQLNLQQSYLGAAKHPGDPGRPGAWSAIGVQLSVPVLAWAYWWSVRKLRRAGPDEPRGLPPRSSGEPPRG